MRMSSTQYIPTESNVLRTFFHAIYYDKEKASMK